jgi:hypothetical protein
MLVAMHAVEPEPFHQDVNRKREVGQPLLVGKAMRVA